VSYRCRPALAVALVSLAPCAIAFAGPALAAASRSHVFLIVLENHEYDEVAASPAAPFLNRLARRGAVATAYHAIGLRRSASTSAGATPAAAGGQAVAASSPFSLVPTSHTAPACAPPTTTTRC